MKKVCLRQTSTTIRTFNPQSLNKVFGDSNLEQSKIREHFVAVP